MGACTDMHVYIYVYVYSPKPHIYIYMQGLTGVYSVAPAEARLSEPKILACL